MPLVAQTLTSPSIVSLEKMVLEVGEVGIGKLCIKFTAQGQPFNNLVLPSSDERLFTKLMALKNRDIPKDVSKKVYISDNGKFFFFPFCGKLKTK
ncbi:hypothetical protein TNIN_465601 [Trichonephila inaurata madagascariensis]|uniref:MSP domain-containing protein n=1 Tax=Trichonephila inaurata madagascariensis TaxID=2747483 RepID=A0A8X6XNS9_9ARAC|nr:hypothetical protein TNIN_465601 [Trichonephila inaurata madagascariensis]